LTAAQLETSPAQAVTTTHDQKETIMKTQNRLASLALLTILCLVFVAPAVAATTLYDNGPIGNPIEGWNINLGLSVSDSFTLSQGSTINGFTAGLDVYPGDLPSSVNYGISATPFGTDLGSGTVTLTNVYCSGCGPGGAYYSTASINPVNLPAGRYYLTLKNGTTQLNNPLYWIENDGVGCTGDNGRGGGCPSTAYEDQWSARRFLYQ
jgi:hypothetical protein